MLCFPGTIPLTPLCNNASQISAASNPPAVSVSPYLEEANFFSGLNQRLFEIKLSYQRKILDMPDVEDNQKRLVADRIQHDVRNWVTLMGVHVRSLQDADRTGGTPRIGSNAILLSISSFSHRIEYLEDKYPFIRETDGFDDGLSGIQEELMETIRAYRAKTPIPDNRFAHADKPADPRAFERDPYAEWIAPPCSVPGLDLIE